MSKEDINLALSILITVLLLCQLGWIIWESRQNERHCTEFGKGVEASRTVYMNKIGCVGVMPDGRLVGEPK